MKKTISFTLEQRAVIQHSLSDHAIVSAVAGSGKTQTLIGRIQYLLQQNIQPHKILIVMFNKSASEDFKARSSLYLNTEQARLMQVKTFHALGFHIMHKLQQLNVIPELSLETNEFNIQKDIKTALQKTYKLANNNEPITNEKIELYARYLSLIKSSTKSVPARIFMKNLSKKEASIVLMFFNNYESIRKEKKYCTYDDLIYIPSTILSKSHALAQYFKVIYDFIVVDEYQDINQSQQILLKILAGNHAKVMAVGDINQTIYEWRGSSTYFILKGFVKYFKNPKKYHLSQTFRYGHLSSIVVNHIISNNSNKTESLCLSSLKNSITTNIKIYSNSQIPQVINNLDKITISRQKNTKSIAVLVRKYSSAILFELNCLNKGITYKINGSNGVFNLPLIKAIIGYLMLSNKATSLYHISKNIGCELIRASLMYPSNYLNSHQLSILSENIIKDVYNVFDTIKKFIANENLSAYQEKLLNEYISTIEIFYNLKGNSSISYFIKALDTYVNLSAYLAKKANNHYMFSEEEVFHQFIYFLSNMRLPIDAVCKKLISLIHSEYTLQKNIHDNFNIEILSIHKSKGLEWDTVILCDMTEKSFFNNKNNMTKEEIEAERRLFYVAITRAKKDIICIGGNDLKELDQWYSYDQKSHPSNLKSKNSIRFIYEMRLKASENFLLAYRDNNFSALSGYLKNKIVAQYYKHLSSINASKTQQ